MLFMGTSVTRGKAKAIVVETGMNTEMGYMISLMKGEETEPTPLQQKVTSISKTFIKGLLAGGIVLSGVTTWFTNYANDYNIGCSYSISCSRRFADYDYNRFKRRDIPYAEAKCARSEAFQFRNVG